MNEQREIPQPASAAAWLAIQKAKAGGGHYSGGRIENFRAGWAVVGFGRAHYLEEHDGELVAACGLAWVAGGHLFAEGNWPRCMNCSRKLNK